MSTIGSVASSAIHATMMKPSPPASQGPPGGVHRKPDGDSSSTSSVKSAITKLLDLSV